MKLHIYYRLIGTFWPTVYFSNPIKDIPVCNVLYGKPAQGSLFLPKKYIYIIASHMLLQVFLAEPIPTLAALRSKPNQERLPYLFFGQPHQVYYFVGGGRGY